MALAQHLSEPILVSQTLGHITLDRHLTVIIVHLYSITDFYSASMSLGSLEHLQGLAHIPSLLQQMDTLTKTPNTTSERPCLDAI